MQYQVSEHLNRAFEEAKNVAYQYSNPEVGTEHILYGLLKTDGCFAQKLLIENGVNTDFAQGMFSQNSHIGIFEPDFTDRVKATLLQAQRFSQSMGSGVIGTEHFLSCMLVDRTSYAVAILVQYYRVDIDAMMEKLKAYFDSYEQENTKQEGDNKQIPNNIKDLGIDLTEKARQHKIDPIIGRVEEIQRIIQILCRKTKNNPVLIGEPGVGKSAVVEGLAKAIVEGNVPELLKNKRVFALDIASLVAGTKYRGALEEKLKGAIDAIKSQGNIIVFIDELHTLAQAGSKEGEVSPADILKPYLARGELQTIGATTTDEYRKFIEKDKALERRFQPIMVAPPSVEDTIEILKGLKENYEAFHKIKISDDAIVAAAKLSDRYIMDRFLPDKAIDLIDEAMSRAKVSGNTASPKQKELEEELKKVTIQMKDAADKKEFLKAAEIQKHQHELQKKIEELKLSLAKDSEHTRTTINEDDIAEIVAKWTKIPVNRLNESESQRLLKLEDILHERVVGQDKAITSVSKAIRRARAGLKDPNRPIGSFLFMGPTGVGKTELTKALSEAMFDDENAVIRLDMSEYMESHSVSKLIGSPPGYVGFDEGGQLTEQVRRKPYSVVLFDEIEKAHPDVYNILLQILDDGRLTDAQGRLVSFKNTIIIMTSNVGASELKQKSMSLGFTDQDEKKAQEDEDKRIEENLSSALKHHFKPEFLNRIDVVCYFTTLKKEDIKKIAKILIDKFALSLKEKNITLNIDDEALDYLCSKGYDLEYGARPLRRVIEQTLEDNIAEGIIAGTIKNNSTINVKIVDGKLKII